MAARLVGTGTNYSLDILEYMAENKEGRDLAGHRSVFQSWEEERSKLIRCWLERRVF